jgi:hypothetical protein
MAGQTADRLGRLTDPDRIWPGWVLDLPADATDRLANASASLPKPTAAAVLDVGDGAATDGYRMEARRQ